VENVLILSQNGKNAILTDSLFVFAYTNGKVGLFAADQTEPEGVPVAEYGTEQEATQALRLVFDRAARGKATDLSRLNQYILDNE